MIPHTPLLLVSTVHTLVRLGDSIPRFRRSLPCSLDFVLAAGDTAHYDLSVGLSSWPVRPITSYEELRVMARRRRWDRVRAEAGDLLLFRDDDHRGIQTLGVVLAIVNRTLAWNETVRCCIVAWATNKPRGRMQLQTALRFSHIRGDDMAIRWYATSDDVERAA